ncbi:S-adenosyl-L-methionine-dependent methyltransferase [Nemania sp. FL0031]|nr:S-adenosyl-L-methionine-dependent methyltransferase [Nemania sp. FL0031]
MLLYCSFIARLSLDFLRWSLHSLTSHPPHKYCRSLSVIVNTMGAGNTFIARVRGCRTREDLLELYSQWADTYDTDLRTGTQYNYVAPFVVAEIAFKFGHQAQGMVLDAGCGTGLVGAALAESGATAIEGLDLSPDMLQVAEKSGAYRSVFQGDLTKEIARPSQFYELVTCVGTFTHGHVGPIPALREFVRILKDNGHIIATILEEIWLPGGFKAEVDKLHAEGRRELSPKQYLRISPHSSDSKHFML